ncbi:hypothetical protein LPW41_10960 [Microbacterium sp. JC 701]|uniref:lipopolysaccharide biosynthesis protein n=1 Tax=Microbacterium sp. JC 701 TaxID=2897389 RepID=UPI001E3E5991|nr:hypothetical protein [Microbacterium sp. JC 701]MCD2170213.1 hypothetical protein [Microbacterium sp. JC 701]
MLLPIVLATVGATPYGIWLVLSTLAMVLNYSDLGVGAAVVHFASRHRGGRGDHDLSKLLSAALMWNFAAALVVVPTYVLFAISYTRGQVDSGAIDGGETDWLVVAGAFVMAGLFIRPFGSALVGSGLLPLERRNASVAAVVRVIGTLAVCYYVPSVGAVATVEAAAALLPSILSMLTVWRRGLAKVRWDRSTFSVGRHMLSFSTRSFVVSLIGALLLQGGTFAAGVLIGPASASYFNAAFRVYSSVRQLIGWLIDPFRAAMSRAAATDGNESTRLLASLSTVIALCVSVGCGALIFSSGWLIPLWLGQSAPTNDVQLGVIILLTGLIANSIHLPFVPAADSIGRPGVFLGPQLLWLTIFAVSAGPLAQALGAPGIALAMSLPLILVEPVYLLVARRVLHFDMREWFLHCILPAAIAAGGAALLVLVLRALTEYVLDASLPGWLYGGLFAIVSLLGILIYHGWKIPPAFGLVLRSKL